MGAWTGDSKLSGQLWGRLRAGFGAWVDARFDARVGLRLGQWYSGRLIEARPSVAHASSGSIAGRMLPALASLDADLEVVVGPSYRGATDRWSVVAHRDPANLVERLAAADVALLGAGTMKFEAACLARPMVLLAAADDQPSVGSAFAATGAARYLGDGRTIDASVVVDALAALLADPPARAELGRTAARVIDGDGADRVAAAIERLAQPAARS